MKQSRLTAKVLAETTSDQVSEEMKVVLARTVELSLRKAKADGQSEYKITTKNLKEKVKRALRDKGAISEGDAIPWMRLLRMEVAELKKSGFSAELRENRDVELGRNRLTGRTLIVSW